MLNGPGESDGSGQGRLASLTEGYQATALLYGAVRLGIPDALAEGPLSVGRLSAIIGAGEHHLTRVLKALVAIRVCSEATPGEFSLTAEGCELIPGSRSGLCEQVLLAVDHYADVWFSLTEGLDDRRTGFEARHGMTPWEYRRRHPHIGAVFDDWLERETERQADPIAAVLALAGDEHVVDVGGGTGALLYALQQHHPHARLTLFDQPHVVQRAADVGRTRTSLGALHGVGGDFFQGISVCADVYILKSVLHDWDDDDALRLLCRCREAMPDHGRLCVVERLLPEHPTDDPATHFMDLHMMLVTGGRERGLSEYRGLLEMAGLSLRRTSGTTTPFTVIDAVKR